MKHKLSFTTALMALGIISSASAAVTNELHVTGSTAFRGNFFTAATAAAGGIFDAPGGTALPAGANNGSSLITYVGKIGGVNYALECSWTGSEAGIANVDGVATLSNPGLPNAGFVTAANLPGATTTFPKIDGTTGGFTGTGDLTLSDTSQAVSLTKPPAHPALHDYGVVGVVTFAWVKGKNSTPLSGDPGDSAWNRLVNVTQPEMLIGLASTVNANFLTGNATDNAVPVALFGRNAGSGTRVNTLLDTQYGVGTSVNQFALNSTYSGSGVLTYKVINNDQPNTYPSVASSLGNQSDYTTTPNFVSVNNDGYESGGGVSQCLSCDSSGAEVITLGYLGLSDAKAARDGKVNTAPTPNQPGGAVFLTLDGLAYNDAVVVNGSYSFWGHEHLYGNSGHTTIIDNAATAIKSGIATGSGLGTGSAAAQSSGIAYGSMLADKSGGGDSGYPAPL